MKTADKKQYSNSGNKYVLSEVPKEAQYILDIGCGCGDNAKILSKNGKIIDGITISDKEAALATKYCRKVKIYDVEKGLPEGLSDNYDVIICSHILEHICYPDKLLLDIRSKMIIDKSKLIVSLPNVMQYSYRFKLMMGQFKYEDAGVMDYTHFRWYTFESGKELLKKNGFNIVKAYVDGGLPGQSYLNWLPKNIQEIFKKSLHKLSPGFFGCELLYVVEI